MFTNSSSKYHVCPLRHPVERETLEAEFHRDRERLVSERDAKVERIRRGEPR